MACSGHVLYGKHCNEFWIGARFSTRKYLFNLLWKSSLYLASIGSWNELSRQQASDTWNRIVLCEDKWVDLVQKPLMLHMLDRGSACGFTQCLRHATLAGTHKGAGSTSQRRELWHPLLRQSYCSPFRRRQ